MKTKIIFPGLIVLALFQHQNAKAQISREIGVRILASQGSDVIFKKEKRPNRFRRFRAGLSNLGYNQFGGSDQFVFSAEAGFGWEKRKEVKENLEFVTGWELRAGLASFDSGSSGLVGIGFILGFQYRITDNLLAGVETIPNIGTNFGDRFDNSISINAGVNSTAAFSIIYRFQ